MATTRVFRSGNSQAVRIPKEFRIDSPTVEIFRRGEEIVLRRPKKTLAEAFHLLAGMSDDFFGEGRKQPKMQKRRRMF
jgi:antitoxin VapB